MKTRAGAHRRFLRGRGPRAALAGRAGRRRRGRGARRRARLPGPALDRARPSHCRVGLRARPFARAAARQRCRPVRCRQRTGSSPRCRCRTRPRRPGRSSTRPGGCCPTSSWPPTAVTSSPPMCRSIEGLVGRITDIAGPDEPPARLHGDLWSGNVVWSSEHGTLIDPAAYGGHRETDLAMLALFGLPHLQRLIDAYRDEHPLADGWEERQPLHQAVPAARARRPVRRPLRRTRRRGRGSGLVRSRAPAGEFSRGPSAGDRRRLSHCSAVGGTLVP